MCQDEYVGKPISDQSVLTIARKDQEFVLFGNVVLSDLGVASDDLSLRA